MNYDETTDPQKDPKAQIPEADSEYLRKAEDELPDANVSADDDENQPEDHITGDMHPTARTETSQEEKNAEQED